MSKFIFGTKARTLQRLYEDHKLQDAVICKPSFFTVSDWRSDPRQILQDLMHEMQGSDRIIVRSSAVDEDSGNESMAGKYASVICDRTEKDLKRSIERVIRSYGKMADDNEVLVQRAIEDVSLSGVVFSIDPDTGGSYFRIDYDEVTGSSSTVTSGTGTDTNLYYWFSGSRNLPQDKRLRKVCKTVLELIQITGHDALNIEFLFFGEELYILQVRPLILRTERQDERLLGDRLDRLEKKIRDRNRQTSFLLGSRTMYGVMPDWNPAEMIGIHPRGLAVSLYRELITDRVWAEQRSHYGYRDLRGFPLMLDFCGHPFIDVRVSFNSFIPEDLDSETAEKLVDYYLDCLEKSPGQHDKVEFEILFSCYSFDFRKRIRRLEESGFSPSEIKSIGDCLRKLTRMIIDSQTGLWRAEYEKLAELESRRQKIEESSMPDTEKILWLLEDCRRYGTLPFAGLARSAFIAVQLLDGMAAEGLLTESEKTAFMGSIRTISSLMKKDQLVLGREAFLSKYGFLRPGTYDICSLRYDEAADLYFSWDGKPLHSEKEVLSDGAPDPFRLSSSETERIRSAMEDHGLGNDVEGLFTFIRGAIEGREYAKFVFTQNVSNLLKYLGNWGERLGFSREDLSYMDIRVIREIYNSTVDEKKVLQESIEKGKKSYREGTGVILPPLITDEHSVKSFHIPRSQPNFITRNRVRGKLCRIGRNINTEDLSGRILLMESADPGYDWIFSQDIKGFITKYGGANSHMAIRSAELNLPAVLGVGEQLFTRLMDAETVEIDAPKKQLTILR